MPTNPNAPDLSKLSPEIRAVFEAQRARIVALTERNDRLEHLVREFRQALHGKKSEKLGADERQLAFEDLEVAAEAGAEAAQDASPAPPETCGETRRKRAPANRNLGRLPKELPRIERVIEPESTLCPCGCGEMAPIGEGEARARHRFKRRAEHRAPRHRAGSTPGHRHHPAE